MDDRVYGLATVSNELEFLTSLQLEIESNDRVSKCRILHENFRHRFLSIANATNQNTILNQPIIGKLYSFADSTGEVLCKIQTTGFCQERRRGNSGRNIPSPNCELGLEFIDLRTFFDGNIKPFGRISIEMVELRFGIVESLDKLPAVFQNRATTETT